ncbi:MAG: UvrD-helicase domain-containing protein [Patescibacteria group bacterium]|jgi:DNA helicase-2/ATP-dependent DNA helicase PcrA
MIDFNRELNQEQLDAVLHGDGACLVLAGAGSGKTRTVTYRVAYLLEQGVDPGSILLLTFTNKAAREMLERIGSLVGPQSKGVWGGTFHAVANRLLRSFAPAIGYTSSFSILDQEDAKSLLKAVLKDSKIDPKVRRFPSTSVISNLHSFVRNTDFDLREALEMKYSNFLDCANDIEFVAKQYDQRKMLANAMDFDDLLVNWLRILEEQPQIAQAIGNRFKYVLVDEYQDTNALQAKIVGRLGQVHRNVFVVGDDAQSIYAFRGADVKNILAFPNQWQNARMFKLLSNYRSTPQILEVANESLKNNVNQYEKELIGLKASGLKPTLVACPSARQEAQFVADQILLLRNKGVALGNIAVLFRATAHSQALEFELMKRDIPFEYRGGVRFFERAHIKDILAYLRILENVKDETAWLRVLNMQQGIGAASASQIISGLRELTSASEVLNIGDSLIPARALSGWRDTIGMMQIMQAPESEIVGVVDKKPGRIVRALVASGSYRAYLESEYPDWKERIEDLEQLASFADVYPDVSSFLADSVLEGAGFVSPVGKNQGQSTQDQERMVLSTVHQAKGLEWDTVFVIHLTNLGFPNPRALEEEDSIEEERRLFYVAVTRARNRLFLSYPQTAGYDAMTFCRPSMFLEELPPRLFERINMSSEFGARGSGFGSGKPNTENRDPNYDNGRNLGRLGRGTLYEVRGTSEDGYDEPSIQLDRHGDYHRPMTSIGDQSQPKTKSVWKTDKPATELPKISYLRDVDDY